MNNDWFKFYLQLKKLSKNSSSKLTLTNTTLEILTCEAFRLDLPSIGSFAFYKLWSSYNVQAFRILCKYEDNLEKIFASFLIELNNLQRFSDFFRWCVTSDSIDTFKCILSIMAHKAHCHVNDHDKNMYDFHEMFDKILNTSSFWWGENDLLSQIKVKVQGCLDRQVNVPDHCNHMRNVLVNAYMAMEKEYFIPILALCCVNNSVKIGEYLLSNFNINKTYVNHWQLSSFALKEFDLPSNLLLGASMIGIACQYKHIGMIELLVKYGANPNILGDKNISLDDTTRRWQSSSFLLWSVHTGETKLVELALKPQFQTTKAILNSIDEHVGGTPLMIAVAHNHVAIVRLLVQAGADINIKNDQVCFDSRSRYIIIHYILYATLEGYDYTSK